jgi:hypothetical protein
MVDRDYDNKSDFLDSEFVGPDDYPEGVEIPPGWIDGSNSDIENAMQISSQWGNYLYKNYKIAVRRENKTEFDVRVFIPEYDDVELVRTNHSIDRPAFIRKVTDGVVWVTVRSFMQDVAFGAGEDLVNQYIDRKKSEKELTDTLSSFNE